MSLDAVDARPAGLPLTLEGKELVGSLRATLNPLIEARVGDRGKEKTDPVSRLDAEWDLLFETVQGVDAAKSGARDYVAAWALNAVALGVATQSDSPGEIAYVHYEFEGGGDNFYDIVGLEPDTGGHAETRSNVPAGHINRLLMRTLREKHPFLNEQRGEHDRQFVQNAEEAVDRSLPAYQTLVGMAKHVDITALCRQVYDFSGYDDASARWQAIDALSKELKGVSNEEQLHSFVLGRIAGQHQF